MYKNNIKLKLGGKYMNYKKVERVFSNNNPHWVGNGFRVKQYFPRGQEGNFYERFSPFILLDYNEPYFFKGSPFEVGVGPHPHRGFETVTFAFAGKVAHGDNQGNKGVIEPGDIQWMTAGEGILHKEYHEEEYAKHDRVLHMIQLWVDLPKKDKMTKPNYQAITRNQMGVYTSDNEKAKVTVYAGEALGVKGPASTFSPMNIYKLDIAMGEIIVFDEPQNYNTGLLMLSGEVEVNNNTDVKNGDFVLFENDGDKIQIIGIEEESEVFILSGEPLDQPVMAMGPFVMTNEEELVQADKDFRSGKFGSLDF